MTKPRKGARKPRVLKARPLLVAVGAAAIFAGCGDDTTGFSSYPDLGFVPIVDMGKPAPLDMAQKTPTD